MIQIRKAHDRGHAHFGWLDTYHSFSFADYFDSRFMGFGKLKVINEDFVDPMRGFPLHGHQNMEIITFVVSGALEHQDTLGNKTVILPGEIQRMTAGSGIRHSEANPKSDQKTHLLQIWVEPDTLNLSPGYEQVSYLEFKEKNGLTLLASHQATCKGVKIHQDLKLFLGDFDAEKVFSFSLENQRAVWIQVIKGDFFVNELQLSTSDGAAISLESKLAFRFTKKSEFLLFDMPGL